MLRNLPSFANSSRDGLIGLATILISFCGLGNELGKAPPPLQIATWVKDASLDLKRIPTNGAYVIIFWETWCDHCMASLPQLVELQKELRPKGVEFVGVSPEKAEVVTSFLTNSDLGSKINFSLACDADRRTYASYMTAFGQTQIPKAFVVDGRGNLVWYGHPLAGLDDTLRQILEGRFDVEASKQALGAEKLEESFFSRARTNQDDADLPMLGRKIISDAATNPWILNNFAWRILQISRLNEQHIELAMEASKAACATTAWKSPTHLDTYALALFRKGDVAGAVRVENQALAFCTNEVLRVRLDQTLKFFEAPRTNNPSM